MKATIKNGVLTIEIPVEAEPYQLSPTGKTYKVASSGGAQKTSIMIDGKPLQINLNAYYATK